MAKQSGGTSASSSVDALGLELERFKSRNAQRSLPDYEVSSESPLSPRSRFSLSSKTAEYADTETPVLHELLDETFAGRDSRHHNDFGFEAAPIPFETIEPLIDAELQASKTAGIISIVFASIAVLIAVFAFGSLWSTSVEVGVIVAKVLATATPLIIAFFALRASIASRQTVNNIIWNVAQGSGLQN